MPSAKSNSVLTPESVHDVWLNQSAELQRDLFDGWVPEVRPTESVVRAKVEAVAQSQAAPALPMIAKVSPKTADAQPRIADAAPQSRESVANDLVRQRATIEHELSARKIASPPTQNQEPPAVQNATKVREAIDVREVVNVHDVAAEQNQDQLSSERVREREELLLWRKEVEAELANARRQFEEEQRTQQQEFAQKKEAEMSRLRREREEFEARVRLTQSELALARQRQEDSWRQTCDVQLAQIRAERAELEKLRDAWLEKLRREQAVLQHGAQFFGQHLSRVSEEFREAQRGLEEVSASVLAISSIAATASAIPAPISSRTIEPAILSLDEIRQRLNELKQPHRAAA